MLTCHLLSQMEQIKRANRLYTNDSIFLKRSLSIPVLSDLAHCSDGGEEDGAGCVSKQNGHTRSPSERKQNDGRERASDLTPADFLKRLDDLISQSKQAAVRGCQEAEKRYTLVYAGCSDTVMLWIGCDRSSSLDILFAVWHSLKQSDFWRQV